jgi:hypothetical protein
MSQLLPTEAVQDNIISSLTKIIPRVIVKYLKAYKEFHNFVVYHTEHPYSHEMKQKSEVVSVFLSGMPERHEGKGGRIFSNGTFKLIYTIKETYGVGPRLMMTFSWYFSTGRDTRMRLCRNIPS